MRRKILVADDERMIRVAIVAVLRDLADAFEVCGEAANGLQMVDLARKHLPDLFVVDIKMPDLGGLEAIRECQRIVPDAGFLILSGVNDFQDARTALQLGVSDYLLKPIRPAELVQAVHDAAAKVDARRQAQADALLLRCREGRGLRGPLPGEDFPGWVFSGAFFFVDEAVGTGGAPRAEVLADRIRNQVGQRLRSGFLPAVLPAGRSAAAVLWGIRSDHPEAEALESGIREQLASLAAPLRAGPVLVTAVALGPRAPLADVLRQVHTLETEPTLRFPFLGHPGVLTWAEVQAGGPDPLVLSVLVSLDGLTASWSAGDSIEFRAHLQGLRKAGLPPGHPLVPNLARFLHTVFALPVTGGPADWAEALAHRSDGWFGREGDPEPAGENQVVALILRKISEDCMLDLSLKQIAGQLGLSANYISTLFHRETKTTFVRYLTGVRMDRAAALLKDSQIPLGEVARLCGYANRAYFEKVFQTVHGVGPAEYRAAREVRAGRNSPQTYGASGPTR